NRAINSDAETEWPHAQPRRGFISSITFDPNNEHRAYATYSTFGGAHVWRSDDGGENWTAIDGKGENALPDVPAHSLAVDPKDPSRIFVGTDLGVFASTDGGLNWM